MTSTTNEVKQAILGILEKQGVSVEEAERRLTSMQKEGAGFDISKIPELLKGLIGTGFQFGAVAPAVIGAGAGGLGYLGYKQLQNSQDAVDAKVRERQQYEQAIKNLQTAVEHPVGV